MTGKFDQLLSQTSSLNSKFSDEVYILLKLRITCRCLIPQKIAGHWKEKPLCPVQNFMIAAAQACWFHHLWSIHKYVIPLFKSLGVLSCADIVHHSCNIALSSCLMKIGMLCGSSCEERKVQSSWQYCCFVRLEYSI